MVGTIRLSEASAQAIAALAIHDNQGLESLTGQLNQVAAGRLGLVPEPAALVQRELRILERVLAASQQNIHVLQGLRERKARTEWEL